MSTFLEALKQYADVDTNVPISKMTTFRIGGGADYVIYPKDAIAFSEAMRLILQEKMPYKILGKGSNILCSDEVFHGVIIRLDRHFHDYYYLDDKLFAQAGCSIISLAYDSMKKGFSGLEFASGIPATIGGAVYMNAGAYKNCMKNVVEEVLVYRDGVIDWVSSQECEFGYRTSVFHAKKDWIILAVRIALSKGNSNEIRELVENRRERRMSSQPLNFPSAGSVFRNPEGKFAWEYIDELGLRGKRIGGAQISEKHPNFIINVGEATAKDVYALIDLINKNMKEKYNFTLEMEVEKFNW